MPNLKTIPFFFFLFFIVPFFFHLPSPLFASTIGNCEPPELIPGGGRLWSPSWPDPYPAFSNCQFNLSAQPGQIVRLNFTHFNLAPPDARSEQCLRDYVLVVITDRQGRQHVSHRMCGDRIPSPVVTMQSLIEVEFHSSQSDHFTGFRAEFEFVDEALIMEPRSFYGDSDRRWVSGCGGHNMPGHTKHGQIVSPGFPTVYPRNVTCNWLIRVPISKRIYIRLLYLELSPSMAECERASLHIIDGYKHETGELRKLSDDATQIRFCGGQLYYNEEGMKSYMSTGNRILLKFVTTDRPSAAQLAKQATEGNAIGFRLLWTEVDEMIGEDGGTCTQFRCQGGHVCLDDGASICASRSQLCIDQSLLCNGVPNCAENDDSDEEHCHSQLIKSTAASLVACLVVVVIVCVLWQSRRNRQQVRMTVRREETESRHNNGKEIWQSSIDQRLPPVPPVVRLQTLQQRRTPPTSSSTFRPALV